MEFFATRRSSVEGLPSSIISFEGNSSGTLVLLQRDADEQDELTDDKHIALDRCHHTKIGARSGVSRRPENEKEFSSVDSSTKKQENSSTIHIEQNSIDATLLNRKLVMSGYIEQISYKKPGARHLE